MAKGTIVDFLQLAAETPALAGELGALAARYDFEFVMEEMDDEQLDEVAGGVDTPQAQLDPQLEADPAAVQARMQAIQDQVTKMSNISRFGHDLSKSIIQNYRA